MSAAQMTASYPSWKWRKPKWVAIHWQAQTVLTAFKRNQGCPLVFQMLKQLKRRPEKQLEVLGLHQFLPVWWILMKTMSMSLSWEIPLLRVGHHNSDTGNRYQLYALEFEECSDHSAMSWGWPNQIHSVILFEWNRWSNWLLRLIAACTFDKVERGCTGPPRCMFVCTSSGAFWPLIQAKPKHNQPGQCSSRCKTPASPKFQLKWRLTLYLLHYWNWQNLTWMFVGTPRPSIHTERNDGASRIYTRWKLRCW